MVVSAFWCAPLVLSVGLSLHSDLKLMGR